jgi:hypothetical protein
MKDLKTVIFNSQIMSVQQTTSTYVKPESLLSPQDIELINRLFRELKAIFTAHKQAISTIEIENDAKKSWVKGLHEAGINSEAQIQLGLKRARSSGRYFFPEIGLFCDWCKPLPEDVGLPSTEDAFKSALKDYRYLGDLSKCHIAIYLAARKAGSSTFLSTKPDEAYKVFKKYYLEAAQGIFLGVDLSVEVPQERLKIEAKPSKAEFYQQHLKKIRRDILLHKTPVKKHSPNNLATT